MQVGIPLYIIKEGDDLGKWINRYRQDTSLWQGDEYKKLFDKCAAAINKFWNHDIHRYMKRDCPALSREIDESEARLDQLWGNAPLDKFRQELVKFYKLHEEIFKRYEMV